MVWRVAASLVLLVLLVSAGYGARRWALSACFYGSRTCPGLRLAGRVLPSDGDADLAVDARARDLSKRVVRVVVEDVPDLSASYTLEQIGVVVDLRRTRELVRAVGHTGALPDRIEAARRARDGQVDIPWLLVVDPAVAERALAPLKDVADESSVPAKLDLRRRTVVAEVPGRFLDLDLVFERVREAACTGSDEIRIRRTEVKPKISSELLSAIDLSAVLARYQTGFSRAGDQASRARNIENGAAHLDGVILLPNEMFSFNAVVGPRTPENGFTKGWEIFKGEMVEGIGGGTCQVASTLHAASVFAGLDILERLPHSRPSAYITMGLDATVVYPVVDLKLRNPFAFPVVVHAFVEGNVLTFELLGREKVARVVFGRQVLATRSFTRKVEEMPGLAPTRVVRKQHGLPGYRVLRSRTITFADGRTRTEANVDVYPPVVEEYLVAPGADLAAVLPPPPEGDAADEGAVSWVPVGPPREAPSPSPDVSARKAASCDEASPGASGCEPPKIVDAPGAHAPTPHQRRAPVHVVIDGH